MAAEAMKDLGSLVCKTKALRNKLTGIVVSQEGVGNFTFWENMVRYADNHQEEFEFIFDSKQIDSEDENENVESDINPDGTQKLTKRVLDGMHYKLIQKEAKRLGLDTEGSKKELIERILEKV